MIILCPIYGTKLIFIISDKSITNINVWILQTLFNIKFTVKIIEIAECDTVIIDNPVPKELLTVNLKGIILIA